MRFLAVVSCPTGVAHTYIAAEAIQAACERAGIECKVETQGILGTENTISEEDVISSDVCILTTDMPIKKRERFKNIPVFEIDVNSAIRKSNEVIADVLKMLEK